MSITDRIQAISREFESQSHQIQNIRDVEAIRVQFLGRKGPIQELMGFLKSVPPEEKRQAGQAINELKQAVEAEIERLQGHWEAVELQHQLQQEWIDVTLPGAERSVGGLHPLTEALRRTIRVFEEMGFTPQLGPEIDTDWYNFGALNFADEHPARDMQDTFYVAPGWVLRTHTSNTQVRVMESSTPPIRVCCPGMVFRNEDVTARSHVQFHQIEALYIAEGVSFAELLATLEQFLAKLFGRPVPVRFRPSYFPFVEPGLECDIGCLLCQGAGCRVCKFSGWLEILGAGLVHPNVLKAGGIDPEKYTGYAWGMGLERLVMLLRGVPDLRLFTENQLSFLRS
jgi:phenylalanyl-tRNA synthetase alpha chain